MSLYVIGDIQGCYDSLRELLRKIAYNGQHDQLWFTGDLVNRGPKSLETLRFIRSLKNCVVVLGNHDLHLLAVAYAAAKQSQYDTLDPILEAPDREVLLTWLRRRPLLHHDSRRDLTLIHAGLAPQWSLDVAKKCAAEVEQVLQGRLFINFLSKMYGDEPNHWSNNLSGQSRLRFITNCLTRLRYIDQQGELALQEKGPLNNRDTKLTAWFNCTGRLSQSHKILFGHWSTLGLYQANNVVALDSGCLWGGSLSAACFDNEGNLQNFTQVTCEKAQPIDSLIPPVNQSST